MLVLADADELLLYRDPSGLRNLFSRYVLSLGLPLEEWLRQLSDAAEKQPEPDVFLRQALAGFFLRRPPRPRLSSSASGRPDPAIEP